MTHAEICPVCNGTGEHDHWEGQYNFGKRTCHGCGGKGWIEIPEKSPIEVSNTPSTTAATL